MFPGSRARLAEVGVLGVTDEVADVEAGVASAIRLNPACTLS
jgi:hypothetical protein